MKRQFNEFLDDIIIEIDFIKKTTKDLDFEDFKNDEIKVRAITRSFEIIGEASSYLPKKIKDKYKEVPWILMKNLRNILIHQYWGVDIEIEWNLIKDELKNLEKQIKEIIEKEKSQEQI